MTTDTQSPSEDLAFLRALVEPSNEGQRQFGETYFAAGLIYGAQMLLHGAQALGLAPTSPLAALIIGLGPSVLFLVALTWISARHRSVRPSSTVGRAVAFVFGAIGLANLALIVIIGSVAWREHSITIWLIYPCTVFVLQGTGWLVAYMLRRRAWLGLVAAGWFLSGIVMGLFVTSMAGYVISAGLGIWLCMALPGWVMLRSSAKAA